MQTLYENVIKIATQAAEAIMLIYEKPDDWQVKRKHDSSPVTAADHQSHAIIRMGLMSLKESYPVLSEESRPEEIQERKRWSQYWLVDPLDGTKEFLAKNDEFTINIALIENHQPVFGLIYLPAKEIGYIGIKGEGAYRFSEYGHYQRITSSSCQNPVRVAVSRHHLGIRARERLLNLGINYVPVVAGSALKFCWLAEGKIDIYLRMSGSSEWDTAAGQCIVEAAGGKVFKQDGKPLGYNLKDDLESPYFLVVGDPLKDWSSLYKQLEE